MNGFGVCERGVTVMSRVLTKITGEMKSYALRWRKFQEEGVEETLHHAES